MIDVADGFMMMAERAFKQRDALAKALKTLCDEIAETEMHGDGAYDDGCSVCKAHRHARKLLRDLVSTPTEPTNG